MRLEEQISAGAEGMGQRAEACPVKCDVRSKFQQRAESREHGAKRFRVRSSEFRVSSSEFVLS
jgi:hypothetical protein